jgi:hypothetical protein
MFWCGYFAWGLRFWAIAGAIALFLGVVAFLLRIRNGDWDIEIPIVVAGSVFVLINLGCCGYWLWCESDFECGRGFGDTFRIPVKYPYQIEAVDGVDEGCLDTWGESGSPIVCGITDYTVQFSMMVGRIGGTFPNIGRSICEEWFSFNLDTGELTCYPSSLAFIDACKEFGFAGVPELTSLPEHFGEH